MITLLIFFLLLSVKIAKFHEVIPKTFTKYKNFKIKVLKNYNNYLFLFFSHPYLIKNFVFVCVCVRAREYIFFK